MTRRLLRACCSVVLVATLAAGVAVARAPSAPAEDNGVGFTPAMGWSSWSYLRHDPTEANVEAQARALVSSGLARVGYTYVNLDDFWYVCLGPQGPQVDSYGRWVPNSNFPPGPHGMSGIEVLANYIHKLGLKFGLYVTPGISAEAVSLNTKVLGPDGRPSGYTADQIANGLVSENNYNCGGMDGLKYQTPGAQDFIDSWADEFAAWGVDYLKVDGVGSFDVADVEAWSKALRQTGRPIHLELSNRLNIHYARTWARLANGWRTGDDVECYCGANGSSYPLTDWHNVELRFDQVAAWQPYGAPGGFNDYDSIEVGNGDNDGLTFPERQTQLSLWALASSPLLLGVNLTDLDPADLALLKNTAVIGVDQDAIDAARVARGAKWQIFAKTEKDGDVVVGLLNVSGTPETISTTTGALGLKGHLFRLDNLWTHAIGRTSGLVKTTVPAGGVALFRVTALRG
ncbi:MAG TPA: glycoside hydrolase family 27 protein [Acidimicrobiales bacterium]|nr:glycoside hydrolase family 27 protein [Acidimicrobiales bacterium]